MSRSSLICFVVVNSDGSFPAINIAIGNDGSFFILRAVLNHEPFLIITKSKLGRIQSCRGGTALHIKVVKEHMLTIKCVL